MDDLLQEFLTETTESMDQIDQDLVDLEKNPQDPTLLGNVFRLVHTIKGTCGFLSLERLGTLAHHTENVLGKIRDGELQANRDIISAVFQALDQIKALLGTLVTDGTEPEGDDTALISQLDAIANNEDKGKTQDTGANHEDGVTRTPTTQREDTQEEETQGEETQGEESLYQQMGGEKTLRTVCQNALDLICAEATQKAIFAPAIDDNLVEKMVAHYTQLLEGPYPPIQQDATDFSQVAHTLSKQGGDFSGLFNRCLHSALVEEGVWGPTVEEVMERIHHNPPDKMGGQSAAALNKDEGKKGRATAVPAKTDAAETSKSMPEKAPTKATIRVNVSLLENLMTMVSEMVLTRNQLMQILRSHRESEFSGPLQQLNHITSELQEGVMKTRMQPISNAWSKLPRVVRDLSLELEKKLHLEMKGADTELDRQILDLIKDPLTHMVRNSADHGIEDKNTRLKHNKPEQGTITLNAFHEAGHIVITVSDDGGGLDTQAIALKAVENGLASQSQIAEMSPQRLQNFILQAGFSTAKRITSVSGRGVGMDVVKTNIEKIGGTIELSSIKGQGTTFTVKIPLTLAIVSALIIECGHERFAIPQISVLELVRCSSKSDLTIEIINDAPVLRLRDRLLPLVWLEEILRLNEPTHPFARAANTESLNAQQNPEQGPKQDDNTTQAEASTDQLPALLESIGGVEQAEKTAAEALALLRETPAMSPFGDVFADAQALSLLVKAFPSLLGAPSRFDHAALHTLHQSLLTKGLDSTHMDAAIAALYKALLQNDQDWEKAEKIAGLLENLRPLILNHEKKETHDSAPRHKDGGEDTQPSGDGSPTSKFRDKFIVVSQVGTDVFGIIVDRVYDTEEIVIKPVAPMLRGIGLFSGNTILGDGRVIMILDPVGIAATIGKTALEDEQSRRAEGKKVTGEESVSLLVFRAGKGCPKAVPLALISRLEDVDLAQIEYSYGSPMIQYRDNLMPLVVIDENDTIENEGKKPVIVLADRDRSMGLIVDEIIDIVDEKATVKLPSPGEGILGNTIVNGAATDMIDVGHYLSRAFTNWFGAEDADIEGNYRTKRVLLIDDSAFFRNLLAPVLSVEGYDVTTATNPVEALRMCEQGEDFDVIVSDIEMPEMNGFDFVKTVRNETRWSDLPVVALSSYANQQDVERGRAAGFNDYVIKNDRDGLLKTLAQAMHGEKREPA